MVSNSLGNVLNNIRLLNNSYYVKDNIVGDFRILIKKWSIVNSIIIFILIMIYYKEFDFIHTVLGTIVAELVFLKAYLEVGFRLELN